MAAEDEPKLDVDDKSPDEQNEGGIDFVTLGMFIIGKTPHARVFICKFWPSQCPFWNLKTFSLPVSAEANYKQAPCVIKYRGREAVAIVHFTSLIPHY